MPGMGAVATTFIAGVELVNKGLAGPVGSLVEFETVRLGKRTDNRVPKIKDLVPLAGTEELVFGGWDAFPKDAYEAAALAGVLEKEHLNAVREQLKEIRPFPAVFDSRYVLRIEAAHRKDCVSLGEATEQVREDMRTFKSEHGFDRAAMIHCASIRGLRSAPEGALRPRRVRGGAGASDPSISPAMVYSYAALQEGVPYANGAPSLAVDVPALVDLADDRGVPVAGKDSKTGQTLMKTIIARA